MNVVIERMFPGPMGCANFQ